MTDKLYYESSHRKDFEAQVMEEAKTIAINTLFADLVESGSEINDLIQE